MKGIKVFVLYKEKGFQTENDKSIPGRKQELVEAAGKKFRSLISTILSITEEDVKIQKDEKGAPYLCGYPDIYINRSYAAGYAVCVMASHPVGVDIETLRQPNPPLARQFYCPKELEQIFKGRTCEDKALRWTRLWTLKEAYGKYLGTGLEGLRYCTCPTEELVKKQKLKITDIPLESKVVCTLVSLEEDVEISLIKL